MKDNRNVFISHSSNDKPLARRIFRRLRQAGTEVSLDETKLDVGMDLPETFRRAIRASSHLIVVWTPAAAISDWVAKEIRFAAEAEPRPILMPLLIAEPEDNAIIENTKGVNFAEPHRFEHAFAELARRIGIWPLPDPDPDVLSADLGATLEETPSIAHVFENPIEESITGSQLFDIQVREAIAPNSRATAEARERALAPAREALQSWTADRVSTAGLPRVGEPEFHALDFAWWCAVEIALRKTDVRSTGVAAYPGIVAKTIGETAAGFEALLLLLDRFPGLARDAMCELVGPEQVRDSSVPVVIELYDAVFHRAAKDAGGGDSIPFGPATLFLHRNLDRLTDLQKQVFWRLVDILGNGPSPGGPLDMLGAMYRAPAFAGPVAKKVIYWVESGLFDRVDLRRRSDRPALLYGFASGLAAREESSADARQLLDVVAERVRKLFRSGENVQEVAAFRWLRDATRLPVASRWCVARGFKDGVYSVQFERWEHARRFEPLARELSDAVAHNEHLVTTVVAKINRTLAEVGIPDRI